MYREAPNQIFPFLCLNQGLQSKGKQGSLSLQIIQINVCLFVFVFIYWYLFSVK